MSQEDFGKLIKRIRQENNLTQKDLAEKYNVTYQAVSTWENGKNLPSVRYAAYLAAYYNVSLDYLMGLTDVKAPSNLLAKKGGRKNEHTESDKKESQ